jgi:hypothetical protein
MPGQYFRSKMLPTKIKKPFATGVSGNLTPVATTDDNWLSGKAD